jgi:hypothetical protein
MSMASTVVIEWNLVFQKILKNTITLYGSRGYRLVYFIQRLYFKLYTTEPRDCILIWHH